jgi:small-conductance mechanosensitive channel
MSFELSILNQWFLPLAYVILGLIAGFIFNRIILPLLRKCCTLAEQEGLEVVAATSNRYITFWFALLGFYMAMLFAPLSPTIGNFLEEILFIMATGSVTLFIAKGASDLFGLYARRREGILRTTSMFKNLIYGFVGIFGALFILQSLGISITPLLAALGVGGIAVALAVQDPLSNFFSGLNIIASAQIRPGDYIKLGTEDEGVVMDISWRNTTLRAPSNYVIIIPNSKLASTIVTNYHLDISDMAFSVEAVVSYDSNLDEVQRIVLDVAGDVIKNVNGSVPEVEPIFLYTGLGDSGISFAVALKAKNFDKQAILKHEFIKRLYRRFEEEGVKFTTSNHEHQT